MYRIICERSQKKLNSSEAKDQKCDHTWRGTDNGAEITGYTVEYTEFAKHAWISEACNLSLDYQVQGLTSGKKYEFRVRAENKAGLGEPSASTSPVTIKAAFLVPKIDRSKLHKQIVKMGQQLLINVPVCGDPAPTMSWHFQVR